MLTLSLALASSLDVYDDPLAYVPGEPNMVETPLDQILDFTQVVFEGPVLEVREEFWLGPTGAYGLLVLRVAVERELYGHVTSGVVDVAVHDMMPPPFELGSRVMVVAGFQTFHARATSEAMEPFVPYDDLLVPAVPGGFYVKSPFDGTISSTRAQRTPTHPPLPWVLRGGERLGTRLLWDEAVDVLAAALQATGRVGPTLPGVTP